jgi:hypothetical protein
MLPGAITPNFLDVAMGQGMADTGYLPLSERLDDAIAGVSKK